MRAWVESIHATGAGAQTIQKAHQILGGVLAECAKQGLLTGNPARGVKLPTVVTREHGYLGAPQVAHLLDEAQERDRMLVAFLAFSGLRFGEAAALTFADLDFANNVVHVRRSTNEVRGDLVLGPPKNGKARQVPGVPQVMDPLGRRSAGREAQDLVFTAPEGGMLRFSTWRRRVFAPAVRRAIASWPASDFARGAVVQHFPKLTPHDLRHTAASLGVSAGATVPSCRACSITPSRASRSMSTLDSSWPTSTRWSPSSATTPLERTSRTGSDHPLPFILRAECRPVRFVDRPAFGFRACFR